MFIDSFPCCDLTIKDGKGKSLINIYTINVFFLRKIVDKWAINGYPVVNGGSDKRSELGVPIFPIDSLLNGEPFGAT